MSQTDTPSAPESPQGFADVLKAEEAYLSQRPNPGTGGERVALCISGGGIRSATFALGVLQGLTERNWLPRLDYLSTVSGGGYVGSWLTTWLHRAGGASKVAPHLTASGPREAPEISHLRQYSNYLTPKLGPLSLDTWELGSIVLRNLILNWLVILPVLFAGLLLPRFVVALYASDHFCLATGGSLASLLLGMGIALCVRAMVPRGRLAIPWFVATLVSILGSAILLPLELRAEPHYSWLATAIRHAFSALHPFGTWPFLILFVLYCALWQRAPRLARPLRVINAIGLGTLVFGVLLLLLSTLYLPHVSKDEDTLFFVTSSTPLFLLAYVLTGYVVVGLTHTNMSEQHREWLSTLSGTLLMLTLVWTGASVAVLYGPVLFEKSFYAAFLGDPSQPWHVQLAELLPKAAAALSSLGALLGGAVTVRQGYSPDTPAGRRERGNTSRSLTLGLSVFLVLTTLLLAYLGDFVLVAVGATLRDAGDDHRKQLLLTQPLELGCFIAGLTAAAFVLSRYISVNKFSLHSMYRNRLVRAYLGASSPKEKPEQAQPIPRYHPEDDMALGDLAASEEPIQAPLHLVNMALNLSGGANLAWQERRAENFTASPLFVGFERPRGSRIEPGYRPASRFGGPKDHRLTLGTVMAISGAAANPNMGYHSSALVTMVMSLFNARLGWWLGNPTEAGGAAKSSTGQPAWVRSGPTFGLVYLLREMFGLVTDTSAFVNLSDGGHFENLALYEMVRRKCKYMIISDGSCDPELSFEDLGNAIRKCRIDLGAEIDFGTTLEAIAERKSRVAVASVRYLGDDEPKGKLIYIKPVILAPGASPSTSPSTSSGISPSTPSGTSSSAPTGAPPVPIDVLTYYQAHSEFPHESTADQFFSESQFESYRMLGLHTVLHSEELASPPPA